MTKEELILKKLDRLERLVGMLVKEEIKAQWVKASTVISLTGWDRNRMERARKNGDIEFKKQNGIWYNVKSIPPVYLKKQTA